MKIININSKKLAVQLDSKILGELIEIENVVEKIGQFGNITKYKLANIDNKSIIYLDLAEDYRKFSGFIPDNELKQYFNDWYNRLHKEFFSTDNLEEFEQRYRDEFYTIFNSLSSKNITVDKTFVKDIYKLIAKNDTNFSGNQAGRDINYLYKFINSL